MFCRDCNSRNITEIQTINQPTWLSEYECRDCGYTWEEQSGDDVGDDFPGAYR